MIHAYNRDYLESARRVLGRTLDFAVNGLGMRAADFWAMFQESGLAGRFAAGEAALTVGRSGVELVYETLSALGRPLPRKRPRFTLEKSPEYWAGWVLAYAQWRTNFSFREIERIISIDDVIADYAVYHEMDSRQWVDRLIGRYRVVHPVSRLQARRKASNLSQSELARLAAVPVRSIQQYEQRQKDLSRAAYEVVHRLGAVLGCAPTQLLEP